MANGIDILVVDDEAHQRTFLGDFLQSLGHRVQVAETGEKALSLIGQDSASFHLVITDLSMPGISGLELIEKAGKLKPDVDFFMVTAHGSIDSAIRAIKLGAFDYLLKPIELEELAMRIEKLLDTRRLQRRAAQLETENRSLKKNAHPVAQSPAMRALFAELEKVAATDTTVLLTGETGSGKEVLARHLHERSGRASGPFVAINCSAIPENLLENEFFGHEKGAFTGADHRSIGYLEQADGGTLFLDELGEMDLRLQPKILRALEERRIRRVGGKTDIPIDVRFVAATNRDLKRSVDEGRFRADLYFRFNVIHLRIPPLRERKEDIPALVEHLVRRHAKSMKQKPPIVGDDYLESLKGYSFPGNVRELANLVEKSMIYATDGRLTADLLQIDPAVTTRLAPSSAWLGEGSGLPENRSLSDLVGAYEKWILEQALARHSGNVDQVALALGLGRSTLYSKLARYGIK